GDLVFIFGGVVPFVWIAWLGVRYRIKGTTQDVPMEALFVEAQPAGAVGGTSDAGVDGATPESGYGSGYRRRVADQDGENLS
ncbi:hypothetical protein QN416_26385, partial [Glaciimonas sp. Cout2]|uniref:hypothetical protein n=1 Tax=Glaciimonas sp. Cout2 TaxID=3048621 RepID=UPI002B234B76